MYWLFYLYLISNYISILSLFYLYLFILSLPIFHCCCTSWLGCRRWAGCLLCWAGLWAVFELVCGRPGEQGSSQAARQHSQEAASQGGRGNDKRSQGATRSRREHPRAARSKEHTANVPNYRRWRRDLWSGNEDTKRSYRLRS